MVLTFCIAERQARRGVRCLHLTGAADRDVLYFNSPVNNAFPQISIYFQSRAPSIKNVAIDLLLH